MTGWKRFKKGAIRAHLGNALYAVVEVQASRVNGRGLYYAWSIETFNGTVLNSNTARTQTIAKKQAVNAAILVANNILAAARVLLNAPRLDLTVQGAVRWR